jgi:hypothetical protein
VGCGTEQTQIAGVRPVLSAAWNRAFRNGEAGAANAVIDESNANTNTINRTNLSLLIFI